MFELFLRKIEAAVRSDDKIFRSAPGTTSHMTDDVHYVLASCDSLKHLDDSSVDYVFTDPPFGSNIFYSDMNLFHEAWLGELTDRENEAVIHTSGRRKENSSERYEGLLASAFRECHRVLKPGHYLSVVFGNSTGTVWAMAQRALRGAGFNPVPENVAILDKGQRSVKGLNSGSEAVVTVDLVVTVRKPERNDVSDQGEKRQQASASELIDQALRHVDTTKDRNPSYVYAATIREAIRNGQLVDHLHLSDVLIALRQAGFAVDAKTGLLVGA